MIFGPIITDCPFDAPALIWRAAGFDTSTPTTHIGAKGLMLHLPTALQKAVPKRQAEFLAGRACARLALRELGYPNADIPQNPDRSPRWPQGISGSISHSAGLAIAAVALAPARVGIDLERLVDTDRAKTLAPAILHGDDASHCPKDMDFGTYFTIVFGAKEAFYKAHFPLINRVMEFSDLRVTALTPGHITLTARSADLPATPETLPYLIENDHCLTLFYRPTP